MLVILANTFAMHGPMKVKCTFIASSVPEEHNAHNLCEVPENQMFAVLKDSESMYRGSTVQLPPFPLPQACYCCCCDLQKSCSANFANFSCCRLLSFFFPTQRQSTLHSQYTFAIFHTHTHTHTHKTNQPCDVSTQLRPLPMPFPCHAMPLWV